MTPITLNEKLITQITECAFQLGRIADFLEGINRATNPVEQWTGMPDEDNTERVFYSNEDKDIVDYHVQRLGKRPK